MYRFLVSCSSLSQARTLRQVISATFGIPISSLLAQHDVSNGGKLPAVLYCPATHRRVDHKHQPDLNDYNDGELDVMHDRLREQVEPFLRGYRAGKRARR